jgi:HEAT repeat protein
MRERVMQRCAQLADDNVDLDYVQLSRVGLDDDEAAVRRAAIVASWECQDRHVAARLTELLRSDPDDSVRAEAAAALGTFVLNREFEAFDAVQGDQIVDALRTAATQPAEPIDVRAAAIESLGYRTLAWVDTLITDAFYDDDRRIRRAAIHAMGVSAQERWLDYLEDEAQSDNPEFRYEAAVAIGVIGSEDGVDILAAMLEDEDREVQVAAIASLGEIGGDEALRYLREFAEDAPAELQDIVQAAIDAALFVMEHDEGGSLLPL